MSVVVFIRTDKKKQNSQRNIFVSVVKGGKDEGLYRATQVEYNNCICGEETRPIANSTECSLNTADRVNRRFSGLSMVGSRNGGVV